MNLIEIPKNEGAFDVNGSLEKACNAIISKANNDLCVSNSTFINLSWATAEKLLGAEEAKKVAYGAEKEVVLATVASAYHKAGYFVRAKYNCCNSIEGYYISRMSQIYTKYRVVSKF